MKKHRNLLVISASLVGLIAVLHQLFSLRFAAGDVYPAYSSLRADPLGTRALYESLAQLPRFRTERVLGRLREAPGPGKALLILGLKSTALDEMDRNDAQELERFATLGGRVVLALAPERTAPLFGGRIASSNAPPRKRGSNKPSVSSTVSVNDRWNFTLAYRPLNFDEDDRIKPVTVQREDGAPEALPDMLSWHSSTVCATHGAEWQTVYAREGVAVVLERAMGKGTVVISTDAYPFSNEALRVERATEFLQWCLGYDTTTLLFDETHLGVEENPGIATLARRYRLHGLAFGLALVAGLYLWRVGVGFMPRREDADVDGSALEGREAVAGFVNLLKRSIHPSELLAACMEEWEKTIHRDAIPEARVHQVRDRYAAERMKPPAEQNPVQVYRDIARLLSNKAPEPAASPGGSGPPRH